VTIVEEKNVAQLRSIRRKQLLNQINALHYQKAPLVICMQHKNHNHCIYLKASPDPVTDTNITATWIKDDTTPPSLALYDLVKIILSTNQGCYEFKPKTCRISDRTINFVVPETATESGVRKQIRFTCTEKEIPITLNQNAIVFTGKLLNYSVNGILVQLHAGKDISFNWLNHSSPAILTIQSENEPVYTGEITLLPRGQGQYLLVPGIEATQRYTPRKHRSRRQKLIPSPDLLFQHPITGKKVRLKISDLSSLGFSAHEKATRATLIPGLLIRNAKISFTNSLIIPCMAQVIYSEPEEKDSTTVRIGCAILDINIQNHLQLINYIQQAQNSSTYISSQIDPEDLFDFFFETGFLYPKKYAEISSKRAEMAQSYLALYQKGVDISRHFTYQHQGQIFGHFSSLRVYRQTWMNQHHAALRSQRAGLQVVRAISEYMNDSYQLNPTNIKYIIGYYQAANKFPQHYFGEFVSKVKDKKISSLDCLSYVNEARKFVGTPTELDSGWVLELATTSDLTEFYSCYQNTSGGLLPEGLDLIPEELGDQTLSETYKNCGLTRTRELYVLRYHGNPKVLVDVQSSDFGLNLSEITNAITVYLIDPSPNYFDVIRFAILKFALQQNKMSDPVMVFPNSYLDNCGFHSDKEYTLWCLDISLGSEPYMDWMNRYC